MKKVEILLSGGSILWSGLNSQIKYVKDIGYDGLEIVLSKFVTKDLKDIIEKFDNDIQSGVKALSPIKSIHQNWRLDMGLDKSYGIKFPMKLFFTILRIMLFPKIKESNDIIKFLSEKFMIPITVHNLSNRWTCDNANKEFPGGIQYEIIGDNQKLPDLKKWLRFNNHNLVLDTRDDQSLTYAKKYKFNTWKEFWKWIGLRKIKSLQLTFIGIHGLTKIMKHQKSLPEEQFLWLNRKNWTGHIVVEVNPLILFFLSKGDMKKGFRIIGQFVRQTLIEGKKWSA